MSVRSLAGAKGVAALVENDCRAKGRRVPFHAVRFGKFRVEYRPELPSDGRFEVMEGTGHCARRYDLAQAILTIAQLAPDTDLNDYQVECGG